MSISIIPAMNAKDAKPPVVNVEPPVVNVAGGVTEMDLWIDFAAKIYGVTKERIKVEYACGDGYQLRPSADKVVKILSAGDGGAATTEELGLPLFADSKGYVTWGMVLTSRNLQPIGVGFGARTQFYYELLIFSKI